MSECIVRFQKRWVDEIKRIGCAGCPIKFQSCPLKEHDKEPCPILCVLPESHGRLVDADALIEQHKPSIFTTVTDFTEGQRSVVANIKNAPTIVPATERSK